MPISLDKLYSASNIIARDKSRHSILETNGVYFKTLSIKRESLSLFNIAPLFKYNLAQPGRNIANDGNPSLEIASSI
jgi:hypothetical protein